MKKTPEQIAADKAAKDARKLERTKRIKAGGEGAIVATLEGFKEEYDERIEGLEGKHELLADEWKDQRADLEKAIDGMRTRKAENRTEGIDVDKFSFSKIGKAVATGRVSFEDTTKGIGYEIEALEQSAKGWGRNMEKKDILTTLAGSTGGLPLPVQVYNSIIAAARSTSVLMDMGVHVESLEGVSAFSVPMETTKGGGNGNGVIMDATSRQEGDAISVTRNGYRLANFTPRSLAMIIGMTNEMLQQGGGFVEQFVRSKASIDFSNKLERLALQGRGQQNSEPTGLFNRTDLTQFTGTAAGTNGRALTFADLSDFEVDLAEANRLVDGCKFITHPGVLRGLKKQTATYGLSGADSSNSLPITPLQFLSMKKIGEYFGYDLKYTTNVALRTQGTATTASSIAFGDFSNMWIPMWGPMEFLVTNIASVAGVSAFESNMFWMRFVQAYDVNIVAPDSFITLKGLLTRGF